MGSRGSFLESSGFSVPAQWHTVDYVDGIKVLEPINSKASRSLPERSNTPGTAYILYRKNGNFSQLRVFGDNRMPVYDIDYGKHQGKYSLHVHYFKDGERRRESEITILHKGDYLFEKYKRIFKGAKL